MENDDDGYWFAAKTWGYGWGLPSAWQGWVALLVYIALLTATLALPTTTLSRLTGAVIVTVAFIAVVVWKGERPAKWRWGRR
jgi:hypothetical protein